MALVRSHAPRSPRRRVRGRNITKHCLEREPAADLAATRRVLGEDPLSTSTDSPRSPCTPARSSIALHGPELRLSGRSLRPLSQAALSGRASMPSCQGDLWRSMPVSPPLSVSSEQLVPSGARRYNEIVPSHAATALLTKRWDLLAEYKDQHWRDRKKLGIQEALRVVDSLRTQAQLFNPGWPTSEDREADLQTHIRLTKALARTAPRQTKTGTARSRQAASSPRVGRRARRVRRATGYPLVPVRCAGCGHLRCAAYDW
jgi:hypothetical protein